MVGMIGALAKSKLLLSPKSIDRDYTPAVHTDIPTHHRVPHYIFTSAFNNVMHYMKMMSMNANYYSKQRHFMNALLHDLVTAAMRTMV